MNVGFIGLGKMGAGMATKLLEAGHAVTVYNRTIERARALEPLGAKVASTVTEACNGDVVITMLANDRALTEIEEAGLAATLKRGGVHVSMSTVSVALVDRLSASHARNGQLFVSAPVFGRPDAAATGKLFIVAAGPREAIERVEPLFGAMGQATHIVSDKPSDANLIKIAGNFMIASMMQAFGEAIALARKAGLPAQTFVDIMTSTIFNVPIYKNYGTLIANERYVPAGFAAELGYKDLGLLREAASALNVPTPLGELLHERFARLVEGGKGSIDWTAIAALSAADAGLRPAEAFANVR